MSLRARLLAVMLAVVAVGLTVAASATYASLRSFLGTRVDQQLLAVRGPAIGRLIRQLEPSDSPRRNPFFGGSLDVAPSGTYAELRDPNGNRLVGITLGFTEQTAANPVLPARLADNGPQRRLFSVPATKGTSRYRVLAEPLPDGGALLVAIPLREMASTLHRLVLVETGVSVGVLVIIGVVAFSLVRLGLRPLENMAETADEIAAGDLSARVESTDGRTEVGRLGLALNAMLGQIEAAFTARAKSEDRLRRFVADASHELRTPLTSIRGHAEVFRHGADRDPEALGQAMRRIESEATRMGVLVDDLLLLARLDEGRPLERSEIDLTQLVADAVADAQVLDPTRPIELEADGPLLVDGDGPRLHQVMVNLLTNARVHTPAATPVHVKIGEEGDDAVIEVADHGPGMDPDEAAQVFERFYRADPSRARSSGGTGLGLSIVAAVVQAHGGSVRLNTVRGDGATFVVRFPRHAPATAGPSDSPDAPQVS